MNPPRISAIAPRRAILAMLVSSFLASSALGQALGDLPGVEVSPWPASLGGGGHFESIELLDLNDDGSMDAVVQETGHVVFLGWLEVFMAPSVVQSPSGQDLFVNDFALVDGAGDLGGRGAIATVGPDGLEVFQWDSTTDAFSRTAHVAGAWIGASEVYAADWNGDGYLDLIGLGDARKRVHIMTGTASLSTWLAGPSFDLLAPAVEVEPIHWTGGSTLELAVTDAFGLSVYDMSGQRVYVRESPLAPGMLAVVQNGSSPDNITWLLGPLGGDTHVLSTLSMAGDLIDVRVMNQGFPLTLATGDYDGDGRSDLGITFSDSFNTVLITNHSGSFSHGELTKLPTGPSEAPLGAMNRAPVAFGDVNGNGEVDVVLASEPAGGIVLMHQDTNVAACCPSGEHSFQRNSAYFTNSGNETYLTIGYDYTEGLGVVDFELTAWRRSIFSDYASSEALAVRPVTSGFSAGAGILEIQIPGPDPTPEESIVYFVLRPLGSTGRQVAPALVLGFSREPNNLNLIESDDAWDEIETPPSGPPNENANSHNGGSQGGIRGGKRIPPFPPPPAPGSAGD